MSDAFDADAIDRDRWIEALVAGGCPICGKAGFRLVARHIASQHNISRAALGEMLRIPTSLTFCAPDLREAFRANAEKAWETGALRPVALGPASRDKLSQTARRRFRDGWYEHPWKGQVVESARRTGGAKVEGARHGTLYGYQKGPCRCDDCRAANREHMRRLKGSAPPSHGASGYENYGCRCDVCSDAHRARQAGKTARRGSRR